MIAARIAGTALHLDDTQKGSSGLISYKKHKIWGIKTLIKFLVDDIFNVFYESLPKNEEELEPEEDLKAPLKKICIKYGISLEKVQKFINKRKESKLIWETLDTDQQAVFVVNSFFEAIEEYLVQTYYICMSFVKLITLDPNFSPKLRRSDFGLEDFGFVFRARGYAEIASNRIFNGGFDNTVKRLNKLLLKEYNETFLEKKPQPEKDENVSYNIEDLTEEKQYVIQMLQEGNAHEKMEAITLIIDNRIMEALNDLEYLLNYDDENVMNAAFDAVVILKGLK